MRSRLQTFKIGPKMYLFVMATILFAVASVSALAYLIDSGQIDDFYKRLTVNSAEYYASLADGDYLAELHDAVATDEYQELREYAEEIDDESLIQDYLVEHGLWEGYENERSKLRNYVEQMDDIEYLYLITWNEAPFENGLHYDMYLIDADDVPLYQTGYLEEREPEFDNVIVGDIIDPVISNGDWGWLCSSYKAVYDSNGNLICHVGCDVTMEQIINERRNNLLYLTLGAIVCACLVHIGAMIFVNRNIVKPLTSITSSVKRFSPAVGRDYESSGVIDLDIHSHDEIRDVYEEIRSMQIRLIDYIDDITSIKREKEQVEIEIGKVSKEAYRDSLTGIGNKSAYTLKLKELNDQLMNGNRDFSIVMVDINCLKEINDVHGHSCGDLYLKGSCHIICEVFKHSPIYRIGGDEFVAIPQGEDYKKRHDKVALLRKIFVDTYEDDSSEPWCRYSASVGIADCDSTDLSAEYVFARADKEMYEEKTKFKAEHNMPQGPRSGTSI